MSRLVASLSLLLILCQRSHAAGSGRSIQILNQSGHRLNIYWINRWNHDELVLNNQEPLLFGADMAINSYATHEFEIQEVVHSKTGVCGGPDGICRSAIFQVNDNEGQVITVKKGMELEHVDNKSIARDQAKELLQECRAKVTAEGINGEETMQNLFECVNTGLDEALEKSQEEIDFQRGIRTKLGSHLAVYACADDTLNTTDSIKNETFVHFRQTYDVKILHDHQRTRIHLLENFVTDEECSAFLAATNLKAVSEENGLIGQRGTVPMDKKPVFSTIQNRALAYAESVMEGATLDADDFEAISYGAEHEYKPHCDGPCDGADYTPGDRVASMIMYCGTADKGGSTIFHNVGIHIKPKKGDAVFVSYMDPDTSTTDNGVSEYTGCPVKEGTKYEVVQYMRIQ